MTTTLERYFIKTGRMLREITIEQASRFHRARRDESGKGANEFPDLRLFNIDGQQTAYVSYNGNVWAGKSYQIGASAIYRPTI